jgi:hypothetical protein
MAARDDNLRKKRRREKEAEEASSCPRASGTTASRNKGTTKEKD